jgi:hypothetical protein
LRPLRYGQHITAATLYFSLLDDGWSEIESSS